MTLKDIALRNLRRRWGKAFLSLAGLIVGVTTMVGLITLALSLTVEVNHKLEKYGANIIVTPRSENLSLAYEGLTLGSFSFETRDLHQDDLARLKTIKNAENIAAVGPMFLEPVQVRGQHVLLAGMDFGTLKLLKPWWKIQGETPGSEELVAGSQAAAVLGIARGDVISLDGHNLTVSGVLAPTGSQDDDLIFGNLPFVQRLAGKPGSVTMVEIAALCAGCPIEDMVRQISEVLPDASVMAIQSVVKGRMQTLDLFKRFAVGSSLLVVLLGGLVVLVTMMGSVRERTSEIGIFRAIGFRKVHVMKILIFEAFLLSLAAGVIGYGLGLAGARLMLPLLAESNAVHLVMDPLVGIGAIGMALVVGVGAGLYPALMAARIDPHEALRSY